MFNVYILPLDVYLFSMRLHIWIIHNITGNFPIVKQ